MASIEAKLVLIPESRQPSQGHEQLFWAGITIAPYLPSTVIPAGVGPDGLPIGVQIVADHLQDHTALTAERRIESAAGGFVPAPDFG